MGFLGSLLGLNYCFNSARLPRVKFSKGIIPSLNSLKLSLASASKSSLLTIAINYASVILIAHFVIKRLSDLVSTHYKLQSSISWYRSSKTQL